MLFRLQPTNTQLPAWESSSYREVAIVRAPTEEEARACAATAFEYIHDSEPGNEEKSPWKQLDLATCVAVDDPNFEADGPTMVISPAFFD